MAVVSDQNAGSQLNYDIKVNFVHADFSNRAIRWLGARRLTYWDRGRPRPHERGARNAVYQT